jgi:transcriptional regulator with XRE-family HTH domain
MRHHDTGMDKIPEFATVGQRLEWWMAKRNRKQTELAKAAGMAQSAVSEIISGRSKRPAADNMLRLARELRLRPEYLVWGEGPPETLHFSQLSGLEAQLVMLFRGLPDDAKRDALLIDVNDAHNRHARAPAHTGMPAKPDGPPETNATQPATARTPTRTIPRTQKTKKATRVNG